MKSIENDYVIIKYIKGTVQNFFKEESHIDLEKAREFIHLVSELVKDDFFVSITQAGYGVSYSKEARALLARRANNLYAAALVSESTSIRVIANFFIRINKPDYPTQFFSTEEAALTWINIQKENFASQKRPAQLT